MRQVHQHHPFAIIITGPTGIGKTSLAIKLAQYFKTEIISADSRQCYKEMSIGTAKPSFEELALVKHYFINSHSIHNPVTAYDFEQYAIEKLEIIFKKQPIALVCGGTGLYLKALCNGLDDMPSVDKDIAAAAEKEYKAKGLVWLQKKVAQKDPIFYRQTENQNPARLLRGLIFLRSQGQSITKFKTGKKQERPFKIIKIGLNLSRDKIYFRINERAHKMMAAGLLKEAQQLYSKRDLKPLKTVGYQELFQYFDGEINLDKAIEKIQQHTRNYAKRQLTWFKKDDDIHWFSPNNQQAILSFLQEKLNTEA